MRAFRVLVGKFEIVGTTGAANGRLPALKSEAVAFDESIVPPVVATSSMCLATSRWTMRSTTVCVKRSSGRCTDR
jgi:hypothetical protein